MSNTEQRSGLSVWTSSCVHSLICLFVWWRLPSRCACPHARFSFPLQLYSPLQMAWRIQLDIARADRAIDAASSFFFCDCDWRAPPRGAAQHLPSPHLPVLHASSPCPFQFPPWCNTAPTGMSGFAFFFFSTGWCRADCDLWTALHGSRVGVVCDNVRRWIPAAEGQGVF